MGVIRVSEELVELTLASPKVGRREQGFPFVTLDENGFPHPTFVSRAEVSVCSSRCSMFVVLAGRGTQANLQRTGRSTLMAVKGAIVHVVKLELYDELNADGVLAGAFRVSQLREDSVGVQLRPMEYRATADLRRQEHWQRSARLLELLQAEHRCAPT